MAAVMVGSARRRSIVAATELAVPSDASASKVAHTAAAASCAGGFWNARAAAATASAPEASAVDAFPSPSAARDTTTTLAVALQAARRCLLMSLYLCMPLVNAPSQQLKPVLLVGSPLLPN